MSNERDERASARSMKRPRKKTLRKPHGLNYFRRSNRRMFRSGFAQRWRNRHANPGS